MGVIYFLFYKLPRPVFYFMVVMFFLTMIVGLRHNKNDHRTDQEKYHVHDHSSPR